MIRSVFSTLSPPEAALRIAPRRRERSGPMLVQVRGVFEEASVSEVIDWPSGINPEKGQTVRFRASGTIYEGEIDGIMVDAISGEQPVTLKLKDLQAHRR
jgi:hypothetical protein